MTVKELRDALDKIDDNTPVRIDLCDGVFRNVDGACYVDGWDHFVLYREPRRNRRHDD